MTEVPPALRRRRRWPAVIVVLLVLLVCLWAGGWYYGAAIAARTIQQWTAREAQAGHLLSCARGSISGFPFAFELHCAAPAAELKSNVPPLSLKAGDVRAITHVWTPTTLNADITGPLTVSGLDATITANWRRAQAELRGVSHSPDQLPEQMTLHVTQPIVSRAGDSDSLFKADAAEIDSRLLSGTMEHNPVLEVVVKLGAAAAPSWHPAAAMPVDGDITAVLRGFADLRPKPWPQRLREFQAADGRIEIRRARLQQGDTIAVATGTLGLSAAGRLDGALRLTVVNLEALLPRLGLDQLLSQQQAPPQLNSAFSALDRLMPGLGNVARQNAGPAIIAGLGLMGQQTELEGKPAVAVPLRFDDGLVSLGPVQLGVIPPLF